MTYEPDIVIYHSPCSDGLGAAAACYLRWPNAEYIPANYGQRPPAVTGRNVLIVDFSYKREVLSQMGEWAKSVIILDHHLTAKDDLAEYRRFAEKPERFTVPVIENMLADLHRGKYPAICALFDMDRSGAMLAWNFAFPNNAAPKLIEAIQDRDLWEFKIEHSKAVATFLRTQPADVAHWAGLLSTPFQTIVEHAQPMQIYHDSIVENIARRYECYNAPDGQIYARINCPAALSSDVCHWILDNCECDLAIAWSDSDGFRSFSVRSRDDRADAQAYAKQWGGGGHRNAAGFRVPL